MCPPPYQTGVGILCLETTLGGNRGVTFPESAAVPVVLQLRPTWRGRAPRRVTDSVGDVLGVRRGEPTGSKEPGAPPLAALSANVFQICSALEFLSSTWMGGVDWMVGCYSLVGDHLETFCLPQAPLRSQQESWRAGR